MRFERMQRVQTRMRLTPPFTTARTRWMLAWNRRGVTLCAWLTFRPNAGPLPQISQRFAIGKVYQGATMRGCSSDVGFAIDLSRRATRAR